MWHVDFFLRVYMLGAAGMMWRMWLTSAATQDKSNIRATRSETQTKKLNWFMYKCETTFSN